MRADLLDAQAGIDWANAQLPVLEARISAWREGPPYKIIEEPYPQIGEKWYKLADTWPPPPGRQRRSWADPSCSSE